MRSGALPFVRLTTTLLLDENADTATALGRVDGLNVRAVVAAIDEEHTTEADEAELVGAGRQAQAARRRRLLASRLSGARRAMARAAHVRAYPPGSLHR